jgi:DNA polymerase-1
MEKKPKILVLLDGNALIHRAYHALPPLTDKAGHPVNAVYGFAMTLLAVLEKFHPEYIAASFDLAGPTFRDEMYEDYKATRTKAPDDLYEQIPRVKDVVRAFNIPIYEKEGFEADDCVGTIARQAAAEGVETIIVTGDNDALQLVTPLIKVFSIRKGIKDLVLYDEAAVKAKYGFGPEGIPEYKGLAGDASDNIPGVKGVGAKTATDLIVAHGTLEGIYAALDTQKPAVKAKLEADKENAFLSRTLGTIDTEAPVTLTLADAVTHEYDRSAVVALFTELGFFSLIKRLSGESKGQETSDKTQGKKVKTKNKTLKNAKELSEWLEKTEGKGVAVWLEKAEASLFGGAGIASVELSVSEESQVSVAWNDEMKVVLAPFFGNAKRPKIVYDAKALMHVLASEKMVLRGVARDTLLIAYLLDAGGNVRFPELILKEFGLEDTETKATALYTLNARLGERIKEVSATQPASKSLLDVYADIDLPLIPILFSMEQNGIMLNREKFKALSDQMTGEIEVLEKDIYTFAGKEFNINSPKQLSEVLFEDLKIPTTNIKKTKTGISTASPELQKLAEYPIIAKIESYRELFKLKTTYLDALPVLVASDGRLHTTFHQTVAATGRLSSSDPNLQNIPARSAWNERIRGAFEAAPGYVLVGADYSQIELRVMAHMCGDASLTEAFARGDDVHRKTAEVVFKVGPDEVTPDMRRQAKVFNFGIMYGMGAFGLAQAAQIDQKEAAKFIAAYFQKFSGVKEFMDRMKAEAHEKGYVETETGRRRYVPEIASGNIQIARSAERMAINMPIQGLAADIMKLAMIHVARALEAFGDDAKMALQVHDELIVEAKEGRAEEVVKAVKLAMEEAYPLRVPLIAEVVIGKNWGEI